MKKQFINVGFEFTAAPNDKTNTNKNYFKESDFNWSGDEQRFKIADLSKPFEWIDERYRRDDCGCEVSTPVIENIDDVTKYYRSFKSFTRKFGFTTDINKAMCGLGGCHIHLDLSWIKETKLKEKLLRNITIFVTNYPQLNWAFNDVNDNTNANSLLIKNAYGDLSDVTDIMCDNSEVKRFFKDRYPFRAFIKKPLHIDLYKCFAIRYNDSYDTVEFRIFDMPNDLERHLLHYDVAMGIYNYCLKLAQANKQIPILYTQELQIANIPYNVSIKQLKESMKTIGISYKRVKSLENNIATRYKWTEYKKNKVVDLDENVCYLL